MKKHIRILALALTLVFTMAIFTAFADENAFVSVGGDEVDARDLNVGDELVIPVTIENLPCEKICAMQIDYHFNKAFLEFVGIEAVIATAIDETTVMPIPANWVATDAELANSKGKFVTAFLDVTLGTAPITALSIEESNGVIYNLIFKVLNDSANTLIEIDDVLISDYSTGSEVKLELANGDIYANDSKVIFEDGTVILVPDVKEEKPIVSPKPAKPVETEKPKEEPKEEKPVEEPKEEVKATFADLDGFQWAEEAIYELVAKGIVNGKSETSYDPASNVTRAEFAKLIVAAFDMTLDGEAAVYTDVTESDWFSKYVAIASSKGIVKGYEDGTFKPNANITREEMCVMLERALKGIELETKESAFADNDSISDWAKSAVDLLSANGIINGRDGGVFAPQGTATRAESAVAIFRTLKNALNK